MNAIAYLRLSSKDQSKSLEYQESTIREYCRRNSVRVMAIFKDNGEDSYTFDRPNYRALEDFIRKYKGECQYLIVLDHDRFSRNLPEALMKISELERNHGVKVLSTNERVDLDTSDPDVFMKRAFDYMIANKELFTIRKRTKQGMRNAKENGRYLGRAPFGYRNIPNPAMKNAIEVNEKQALIVERIFKDYLLGIAPYIIYKTVRPLGFTNRGNSAITDILKNPLYAGLIRVPAFQDLPEKFVKGLHKPIITEAEYWQAHRMLSDKRPQKVRADEEFPLRGVLRCWCGQYMTAAWSKGRRQYYLYYKCHIHYNVNVPGKKLHEDFDEVLKDICFEPKQLELLRLASKALLEQPMLQRQTRKKEKIEALANISQKIVELEDKYMNNKIEDSTYQTWFRKFREEKAEIEIALKAMDKPKTKAENESIIDRVLPDLTNIHGIYDKSNIFQKHVIVRGVFKDNLVYSGGSLRTAYIDPAFHHNVLKIKKKGLLILEQPFRKSDLSPVSTQRRSRTGTVSHRCLRPARLPIPPAGHLLIQRDANVSIE